MITKSEITLSKSKIDELIESGFLSHKINGKNTGFKISFNTRESENPENNFRVDNSVVILLHESDMPEIEKFQTIKKFGYEVRKIRPKDSKIPTVKKDSKE